jgi:hypothetical protein
VKEAVGGSKKRRDTIGQNIDEGIGSAKETGRNIREWRKEKGGNTAFKSSFL